MKEYHKIETLFNRYEKTKKLIQGSYRNETFEYLKDNIWQFTEKVDGTNIRIYWDGHRVSFGGRTDNAQIPAHLINRLNDLFGGETNEQLFEQKFGVDYVLNNRKSIIAKNGAEIEGFVGRPKMELNDRTGKRVIVKIKYRDFN